MLSILAAFFDELASMTVLRTSDIIEMIGRINSVQRFSVLSFPSLITSEYYYGCNMKDVWRSAVTAAPELYVLDGINSEYLLSFADNFGRGTVDNFAQRCKNYSRRFCEEQIKEQGAYQKTGRLAVGSAFLSAAMLVIVLI